jgi:hypothetical protein
MWRKLLFLSVVLLALSGASPASATKPIREVDPSQEDALIRGQCGFAVLAHIDGKEIITTFVDAAGDPVKQIVAFPANTLTLTNMSSGRSITVVATGSFQLRAEPGGSLSAKVTGHGPFVPHPITGEPGIWYLSGHAQATLDSHGNATEVSVSGTLVNVCPLLAA